MARRRTFELYAFDVTIEREIKIEPRLFSIGDNIETCRYLVVNGCDYGIVLEFCTVGSAELIEVSTGKLKPTGEWVAANDRRAERVFSHKIKLKSARAQIRNPKSDGRKKADARIDRISAGEPFRRSVFGFRHLSQVPASA